MRRLVLLACILFAPSVSALPVDCASLAPAALADAFEQWWLAGRLHEDGAGVCLDRLRATQGDGAANTLRQARRHGAAGKFDTGIALAQAQVARTDLSALDRAEAVVTLAELLLWRDRLTESRALLEAPIPSDAGAALRLRALFTRVRAAGLALDVPSCIAAAGAAHEEAERRFAGAPNALAIALLNEGICQRIAGDHGPSLANFERACELGRAQGEDRNNQVFAQGLVLLAQGYKISGDMARARRGYDEALTWLRAHPEPFPAQLAALLHGMANLDRASGDPALVERSLLRYAEAETLMERVYGADSARFSQVWNNHGNAFGQLGRYDEAVAAYARALQIAEARGDDVDVATLMPPISNIGMVRLWQKRYADAETGFRRGLALVEGQPVGSEMSTLFSRLGLASALWGQGHHGEAYAEAEHAERDRQLALAQALANMSETSAIHFQESLWPGLDLAVAIAHASGDATLVARAWSLTMAARGQVSAGIAARLAQARSSTDPALRARFDDWRQRNLRLAQLRLDGVGGAELIAAEDAFDRAARALAIALPGAGNEVARAEIDPAQLQPVLRALDASLVGFVSSTLRSPDEYQRGDVESNPRDVYAFVARVGQPPRLLRLADERALGAAVAGWRAAAGNPHASPVQVKRAGERVRRLVFDPLGVPTSGLLLQVPYGDLHELNPAALPDGEGYLVERGLRAHALNHERELLREAAPATARLRVLAVSDPQFAPGEDKRAVARAEVCAGDGWRALPGSRREVAALDRLLPKSARLTDLHGAQATRSNVLAALAGQELVHIATHGLRRDRECAPGNTLAARGASLAPLAVPASAGDGDDGVGVLVLGGAGAAQYLGEADIAAASLEDARWVVLSACDTGLGDSRAYEGAFGLRRAFHLAGARTVIMSLWRVDDAATADWMAALYAARFEHGAGAADAVAAAQRATLTARRAAGLDPHPYYWAAFISAGDWR